jgi:hypothetical protein
MEKSEARFFGIRKFGLPSSFVIRASTFGINASIPNQPRRGSGKITPKTFRAASLARH